MKSEVFNMDCIDAMKAYPDNYFDLCLTDPPYGVNLKYNTYEDTLENWYNLMDKFIPEVTRISKMVIFPSCSINKLEWIYKNYPPSWIGCWYKGSTGHNSYIGFNDWEPLLIYGKIPKSYIHDYFNIPNTEKMGNHGHPCPKPIKWFRKIYQKSLYNTINPKVLDCFMGSGSSRIAADMDGYDFTGFELDKDYFDASCKRFNEYKMQTKLF